MYMGHRRFLPINHPLRRKHAHYDGKADHRTKPRHHCGKMCLSMCPSLNEAGEFNSLNEYACLKERECVCERECVYDDLPFHRSEHASSLMGA